MFTGIVEELGTIVAVTEHESAAELTIGCSAVLEDVRHGASIAVNGVCLTVTSFTPQGEVDERVGLRVFTADVMLETLRRSALGALVPGERVNLERPVRLADRLGGHLVQGHVDGVGTIAHRAPDEHWEVVRIELPEGLDRYLVEKGSITVDGVSLTVVEVTPATAAGEPASFTVSLIPTTLAETTLGARQIGAPVNLEVDVVAKYVEKLVAPSASLGVGALPSVLGRFDPSPPFPVPPTGPIVTTGKGTGR
ncbi:riboflavin synthase [Frankia sp. CNm7]|uniref:Riboflavin synthase n=1 Tax=Frankia nepalensis TaxID=1836974 RepID=A0A937RHA1_9ACTN|nr:riboflavin synthase [Frankia nepalensis]MBL7501472.1 riboflavin synthase [Frankia nepalensis]MBL7515833.1 riboflavin synthase [Frankia nepalensis]MBL7519238.1 riboflavin synthase [Frankia nepalensis]MBL7630365.1 riboflavin synthase [Frankia nepalensis]